MAKQKEMGVFESKQDQSKHFISASFNLNKSLVYNQYKEIEG